MIRLISIFLFHIPRRKSPPLTFDSSLIKRGRTLRTRTHQDPTAEARVDRESKDMHWVESRKCQGHWSTPIPPLPACVEQ